MPPRVCSGIRDSKHHVVDFSIPSISRQAVLYSFPLPPQRPCCQQPPLLTPSSPPPPRLLPHLPPHPFPLSPPFPLFPPHPLPLPLHCLLRRLPDRLITLTILLQLAHKVLVVRLPLLAHLEVALLELGGEFLEELAFGGRHVVHQCGAAEAEYETAVERERVLARGGKGG